MQTRCHLSVLAQKQAEKFGEREAFTYKDFGGSAWKFSGDKHKSLQVDTERTFHQRCPLVML